MDPLSLEELEEERIGQIATAVGLAFLLVLVLSWWGGRLPEDSGGENLEFLTASQQSRVGEILVRLEKGAPADLRISVEIADLPPEALVQYLSTFARSGREASRRSALQLMMLIPPPLARDALLEAAMRTGCPLKDQVLARAASMDRAGTILRLVQFLEPEGPMSRRVHAAFALGTLRGVEAFSTLARLCRDPDEVPFLRRAAVSSLGRLDTPGLEGVLLGLLEDQDETFVSQVEEILRKRFLHLPKVAEALAQRKPPPPRPRAAAPGNLRQWIRRYARRHRLDPHLVTAVIQVESDFRHLARSRSGAQGLMQLMPETAAELGVEDPYDIRQNIAGGTRYLRKMLDRFGSIELALAAYNAGPTAVDRYDGIPPFPETRRYVKKVKAAHRRYRGR